MAEKALKGAPFEMLRTPVPDGNRGLTEPLEPLAPPHAPIHAGRATLGRWEVVQRVDITDGAAAQARTDLENGANALALVLAEAPSAFGRGLRTTTLDALDEALGGVDLGAIPLHVEAGAHGLAMLTLVCALAARRGTALSAVHAGADPFALAAATGLARSPAGTARDLADTVRAFTDDGALPGTAIAGDGRVAAEAGASPVEELAFALTNLHAALRLLDDAGLPPAQTLPVAALSLTASHEQIPTIAKLRAARALARLYGEAFGVDFAPRLHVTTLRRMLAVSDPHTNLLRLAIAAFSAGVGGADAVTVLPFDTAASPFGRRLARNLQTLLLEEAHVDALSDPGAGSGAIEAYTDAIASAAWQIFQQHSDADPAAMLSAPHPMAAGILASAASLDGERVIIGVTRHPPTSAAPAQAGEAPTLALTASGAPAGDDFAARVAAAAAGATLAELGATPPPETLAPVVLAPTRASAPFEA
ncbi:MAG: hypothetical protein AcusKO_23550 [Acuticoccus sp.]